MVCSQTIYIVYTHTCPHIHTYTNYMLNFRTYLWPRYVTRVRARKLKFIALNKFYALTTRLNPLIKYSVCSHSFSLSRVRDSQHSSSFTINNRHIELYVCIAGHRYNSQAVLVYCSIYVCETNYYIFIL